MKSISLLRNPAIGTLGVAIGALALAPSVQAQQLMGLDGPSATVRNFNGGNNDDCLCPDLWPGGYVDQFDFYQFFNPCSAPKPFSDIGMIGGVAHDSGSGQTYVTDGDTIGRYDKMSSDYKIICHFPRPDDMGMLTGMGFCPRTINGQAGGVPEETKGTLWVTDGFIACEIDIPECMMGCGPEPEVLRSFDLPWEWAGLATGITYDPKKEALFYCTSQGNVFSTDLDGNTNIFKDWSVSNPNLYHYCPMNFMLTGITADRAYYGTGTVFVTDGEKYIRVNWGGFPADNDMTPSFSWYCDWCYEVPDGEGDSDHSISGLAYNLKCNTYGPGSGDPEISAEGEFFLGNSKFELCLDYGVPGSIALLLFGLDYKCHLPPQTIPIVVEGLAFVDLQVVGPDGTIKFPLDVPPGPLDAAGLHAYFQWIVIDLWGGTYATKGLVCQLGCL